MPFVEITMVEGFEATEVRALIDGVHNAVTGALSLPDQSVRIAVRVIPQTNWSAGNVTYAEKVANAASASS